MNTTQCDKCGKELQVGDWAFCPHPRDYHQYRGDIVSYPFTTKMFTGRPIVVTDAAHDRALQKAHGCVKRDDVAWVEKEYSGYNPRTKRQEYKETSGAGLPGVWFGLVAFLLQGVSGLC